MVHKHLHATGIERLPHKQPEPKARPGDEPEGKGQWARTLLATGRSTSATPKLELELEVDVHCGRTHRAAAVTVRLGVVPATMFSSVISSSNDGHNVGT